MPQKSHKLAAQQARLRGRKKRMSKGPSGIPVAPPTQEGSTTPPKETPSPIQDTTARPRPVARRSRAQLSTVTSTQVGTELRRIGLLMGAIFVILVVVSIILR